MAISAEYAAAVVGSTDWDDVTEDYRYTSCDVCGAVVVEGESTTDFRGIVVCVTCESES